MGAYVAFIRGTPLLVQALLFVYGLPQLGVKMPRMTISVIALVFNSGAYMAEIIRAGIQSIDHGQTEAAESLGMSKLKTMVYIILPQAIRNILPATGKEFVINIKVTSVLIVIMVSELFFMTKSIKGAIYRTFEPFFITCVIYFILTFTVTRILRAIERKMDGPSSYVLGDEAVSGGRKRSAWLRVGGKNGTGKA
jgi:putative lysine transport system permease protein